MKRVLSLGALMTVGAMLLLASRSAIVEAGTDVSPGSYKVLEPISHGNLSIFPVVASKEHDTSGFLTLDEGVRSGEVVVTEIGKMHTMIRRPHPYPVSGGAEVNRLVLVNNSKRPLILLAGEVVTGGKQDRIVSKDRIVPAESDPVDLGVFCVEPGRWVESAGKFDTHSNVMVQPSVRKKAMVDADQQKVWDAVRSSQTNMTVEVQAAAPRIEAGASAGSVNQYALATRELGNTTSYAKVQENAAVQKQVQDIAEPMQKSFESVIKQLRDQNAVGVVVAVKGRIIWADIFASNNLLTKYWPKLLQSYATEALTETAEHGDATLKSAQAFLNDWESRHEVVESEPGLYRQTEMQGDKFKAFELTSLLPKLNFDVHVSKMAD